MNTREKLLLVLVFIVVVVGFAMTHFGRCLARFIENCFAVVLLTIRL